MILAYNSADKELKINIPKYGRSKKKKLKEFITSRRVV